MGQENLSQLLPIICESKNFKKKRITPICKRGPSSPALSSSSPSSSPSSSSTSLGFSSSTSTFSAHEKHDGDEEQEGWEEEDQERNRGGSVPDKFPHSSSSSPVTSNTPPPSSPHTPLRLKPIPGAEEGGKRKTSGELLVGNPPRPIRVPSSSTGLYASDCSDSPSSPARSSSPGPRFSECPSPRSHGSNASFSISSLAYKLQTKSRTERDSARLVFDFLFLFSLFLIFLLFFSSFFFFCRGESPKPLPRIDMKSIRFFFSPLSLSLSLSFLFFLILLSVSMEEMKDLEGEEKQ